jgi:hypothetical protein
MAGSMLRAMTRRLRAMARMSMVDHDLSQTASPIAENTAVYDLHALADRFQQLVDNVSRHAQEWLGAMAHRLLRAMARSLQHKTFYKRGAKSTHTPPPYVRAMARITGVRNTTHKIHMPHSTAPLARNAGLLLQFFQD